MINGIPWWVWTVFVALGALWIFVKSAENE
jgi:hypothetical protein